MYSHRKRSYGPLEILNFPWVKNHHQNCISVRGRMQPFCYSSTGFVLLGMVLAQVANVSSWEDVDQAYYLPIALGDQIRFANSGTPIENGAVDGHDRTSYNTLPGQAHHDRRAGSVAGVLSGWTGSNALGTPLGFSRLMWGIYGPEMPKRFRKYRDLMLPEPGQWYGLATHNLGTQGLDRVGQGGIYGRAYGHFGASYGYQSIAAYFPEIQAVITVASDLETDIQEHPALALCFAYNGVLALMFDRKIRCRKTGGDYWGGGCTCNHEVEPDAQRVRMPAPWEPLEPRDRHRE